MKLFIARHGSTLEKEEGLLQGHIPGTLSPTGRREARELARALRFEAFAAIYASDLARAADTAKEVARFHPGTPLHFTPELRERNLGVFEGKKKAEVGWEKTSENYRHPTGGESIDNAYRRAEKFLERLLAEHAKDTVLLVAHQDINFALVAAATGEPAEAILRMENKDPASFVVVEMGRIGGGRVMNSITPRPQ